MVSPVPNWSTQDMKAAIENAIAFLESVEWNDHTSETDAANVIEALRQVLEGL